MLAGAGAGAGAQAMGGMHMNEEWLHTCMTNANGMSRDTGSSCTPAGLMLLVLPPHTIIHHARAVTQSPPKT